MTVHSLPLAVVDERQRRTWSGRLQMALILLVCAAPVIASYWAFYVARPGGGEAAYGTLIQPSVAMPDVVAADLQGGAVPLRSLKGQWLLIVVGPAACDAGCEQRLFLQRQLREMLGRERDRVDKVWLITDEAALKPELHQALTSLPPVTALRLPRAVVAGVAETRGRSITRGSLVPRRSDGRMDDAHAGGARSVQDQARPRALDAGLGLLGHAGSMRWR